MGEKGSPSMENRLLMLFFGFSVLGHIGVYGLSGLNFLSSSDEIAEEWAIEVDMSADMAAPKSALPKAEKKPEPKASKKMLPQLPKTFAVEKPKAPEEGLTEVADKEKADKGKDDELVDSEVSKEDIDAAKKLKMKEALKRLAMEELRKQKKLADKAQAPQSDPLAAIAEAARKAKKSKSKTVGLARQKRYGSLLEKQINRHYKLPQTFSSPIAELRVVLAIIINSRGKLVSVKVHESSKDPVFDEYTVAAAKDASPYELPPKSLAGRQIRVVFTR